MVRQKDSIPNCNRYHSDDEAPARKVACPIALENEVLLGMPAVPDEQIELPEPGGRLRGLAKQSCSSRNQRIGHVDAH
jgi:hypothetical protein